MGRPARTSFFTPLGSLATLPITSTVSMPAEYCAGFSTVEMSATVAGSNTVTSLPVAANSDQPAHRRSGASDKLPAARWTNLDPGGPPRWLPSMSGWWRFGQNVGRQLASITRATRPAGKYQFSWDGRDQNGKPVPAGTYTVWIETSFEHGGHVLRSVTVRCGDAPATASLPASPHYDALTLSYNRGKN